MPDQEHPVVAIEDNRADPERHAAGDPPIKVQYLPQLRLELFSPILQDRHGDLGWPDIAFNPWRLTVGV
jgi:hypothetical protein